MASELCIPDFPDDLPPAWRGDYEREFAKLVNHMPFEQAEFRAVRVVQKAMRVFGFGAAQQAEDTGKPGGGGGG